MSKVFDHEKLHVYQASIDFLVWLETILERIPKRPAVYDQLDRASTAIPLNIAEGNGKAILLKIVSMLVGLIKSNSADRVYESQAEYGCD